MVKRENQLLQIVFWPPHHPVAHTCPPFPPQPKENVFLKKWHQPPTIYGSCWVAGPHSTSSLLSRQTLTKKKARVISARRTFNKRRLAQGSSSVREQINTCPWGGARLAQELSAKCLGLSPSTFLTMTVREMTQSTAGHWGVVALQVPRLLSVNHIVGTGRRE